MSAPCPPYYLTCLRDLTVSASIGIHDFEQTARQPLSISVALFLPLPEDQADGLAAVRDYDFVRTSIGTLVASRHFNLQETLCREILDFCLAAPEVLGAIVRTEKPEVYPDAKGIGCRMARFREPSLALLPWWSLSF